MPRPDPAASIPNIFARVFRKAIDEALVLEGGPQGRGQIIGIRQLDDLAPAPAVFAERSAQIRDLVLA